jgi:phosphoenolpyruvate synthase/pyruvate phosphate dikinase
MGVTVSFVVPFSHPQATTVAVVGGKGANLGHLTGAGFRVPPGFTVSTDAYTRFIDVNDLRGAISGIAAELAYDDPDRLEQDTDRIRRKIIEADLGDDIAAAITAAYAALGDEPYVAVRSSGTAEDTASASFAGLHDTYLDIRGSADVVDAVKRCWASMWSARATAYRHTNGFDQDAARIAVVVQAMVESEVSGVMFTANPLAVRTDEIVLNASWGLGEAIVSGIVTPDEYTLALGTLAVKKLVPGDKNVKIVRSPDGKGTVTEPVPDDDRDRPSLDDAEVAELGVLGRRIMDHYGGLPQDIEWGLADGQLYVLQSRPVTGADFLWEEYLETWQRVPEDDNVTWSYKWAEQFWTGGITPLFYSVRGREFFEGMNYMFDLSGFEDLEDTWYFKWSNGTAYYNVDLHRKWAQYAFPRFLRVGALEFIPETMVAEVARQPLDVPKFLRMLAGVNGSRKSAFFKWEKSVRYWIDNKVTAANGLSDEELRRLSDDELKRYADSRPQMAKEFMDPMWVGGQMITPILFGLFVTALTSWYDGDNPLILQDLISGLPTTLQSKEMHDLFRLSEMIRASAPLQTAFRDEDATGFLAAAEHSDDGRQFLERYHAFLDVNGHRGHADRDVYFTRRVEDPSLDHAALQALLNAPEPTPPWEIEARVAQRRQASTEDVMARLRSQQFGTFKASAFRFLHEWVLSFLVLRDDWRHYIDRITFSKRRAFLEVGRRAAERGALESAEDCFFLADIELYAVLDGIAPMPVTKAKIAARRRAFDRMEAREFSPPTYLRGRTPITFDTAEPSSDGSLRGLGTSGGTATGRARIVPELRQIGRVEKGDILICNATDPGWAPVFTIINGLIIETGGMLAHGSCLSREHGIPAVQLRNAMQLIPEGAEIRIQGGTGEITIVSD